MRSFVFPAPLIVLALVSFTGTEVRAAEPTPNKRPTLLVVTNGDDATVSIFDASSAPKLTATIPVGKEPRELCVAPDGNHAYIMNRADNSVSVIDLQTLKATATITHSRLKKPEGCAVGRDSSKVYVASSEENAVVIVSADNNQVAKTVEVGKNPRRVAVAPDGKKWYSSSEENGEVLVLDTATDAVLATIKGGHTSRNMVFSPDGKQLLVLNTLQDTITFVDTETNQVMTTIGIGTAPQELAVTSDGVLAFALSRGNDNLNVIWMAGKDSRKSFRSVELLPWGIDMAVTDRNIYVVHDRDDALSVVRARTLETFRYQTVKTGRSPQGIAVRP
jgi:YVTN family beta-propeller protein